MRCQIYQFKKIPIVQDWEACFAEALVDTDLIQEVFDSQEEAEEYLQTNATKGIQYAVIPFFYQI